MSKGFAVGYVSSAEEVANVYWPDNTSDAQYPLQLTPRNSAP